MSAESFPPTTDTNSASSDSFLTLRVVYIGPNMDLAGAAYRAEHEARGHAISHVASVDYVKRLQPKPDVVVINPLVMTSEGIDGACALQSVIPDTTVMVALYTSIGSSHAMYTRHALSGDCHPRMLLHYPNPMISTADVVEAIDKLARGRGGGPQIVDTGHLPAGLTDGAERLDLGRLLKTDAQATRQAEDSLTYGQLLHVAATDSSWTTFTELAEILRFATGTVKNKRRRLGEDLYKEILTGNGHSGRPLTEQQWRLVEFTRFVTEHRSFIRAYCKNHIPETACKQIERPDDA